jgi:hypothetical protein
VRFEAWGPVSGEFFARIYWVARAQMSRRVRWGGEKKGVCGTAEQRTTN